MIRIKNLSKIKNGQTILDIDSITINNGEIVALIGTADSGLDTLLSLFLGKEIPSAGSLFVDEIIPTEDQQKLMQNIGVLFQENSLYDYQTVEKNLKFFARLFDLSMQRVSEILQYVGLADQAKRKVHQLNSGLARRLALGRALLHHPHNIILEHPFNECDDDSLYFIQDLLRQEADNGGAILILDEDSTYLEEICSRIYHIKQGRIGQEIICSENHMSALPFKIPVKLEGRVALLNPGDILYAEASQGHTLLFTRDSILPSQFTLQELEDRLKRSGFFRAHRSFLVNLQHVYEVIPYSRNSFSLRLNDKNHTEIPLSKNSAAELRNLLDF